MLDFRQYAPELLCTHVCAYMHNSVHLLLPIKIRIDSMALQFQKDSPNSE